jgi:hypothetical protein
MCLHTYLLPARVISYSDLLTGKSRSAPTLIIG